MKKLLIAAGLLSAASLGGASAASAQGYVYDAPAPYGYTAPAYTAPAYGSGYYDYAPGYGAYNYDYDRSDSPGRGDSAESQR
jgi:hypothetical protein